MTWDTNGFAGDDAGLKTMLDWIAKRIEDGPDPANGARSKAALDPDLAGSITTEGLGWDRAFALFSEVIAPTARPFDHPTSLSFVAAAPSPAASALEAVLGAAEIFAGNWDGGSGAIHCENQALAWLAERAGWPETAGGTFVSGGTQGNLSALHAARVAWQGPRPDRFRLLASAEAHSSIAAIARVMDVEMVTVPADAMGRIDPQAAKQALETTPGIFAILGNAGATNSGAVDDLEALADLAQAHGIWLHVDGAYGLGALADPETAKVFKGIERADSLIVDPHKWLFAPYDSCALLYRDARRGAEAHGQQGVYLDVVDKSAWNPSNFAIHLSRRPRGLPFWFSLATYGSEAYARAIRQTVEITKEIAAGITATEGLDLLLGPQLTVLLFRAKGYDRAQLEDWAEVHRRSGDLLCLPTTWQGEPVLRICVVNPATDPAHVLRVLRTLV